MKSKEQHNPNTPIEAILQPDSKDEKTGRTIPNDDHVWEAKKYVDENKK